MLKALHSKVNQFFQSPSAGGVVLALAALVALVISNSPWNSFYDSFLHARAEVRFPAVGLELSKPLILWINDFWMAIFFFLVGLEIKRELLVGELASVRQALVPAVAALGGMVVPALLYVGVNWGDTAGLRGWAVPTATDIAFALGVVALLGSRVPVSLKIFLTAVAIIDDLGAILIIAFFYTANLSLSMLAAAGFGVMVLWVLNRLRVTNIGIYVVVGLIIWVCVLKSGIHATLAGVITALAIPLKDDKGSSPLQDAEHALHPWVAFAILPLFAFANAGVSFAGMSADSLTRPVTLGIVLGLVVGKPVGVFVASWIAIRLLGGKLPEGATWMHFLGICVLCGIGFTMSLFIGALAFEDLDAGYEIQVKLGVLVGSILSGALGVALLLRGKPA